MIAMLYANADRLLRHPWFPLVAMLALAAGLLFSCDPWEGQ